MSRSMVSAIPIVKVAHWRARMFRFGLLEKWDIRTLAQRLVVSTSMQHGLARWTILENLHMCQSHSPTSLGGDRFQVPARLDGGPCAGDSRHRVSSQRCSKEQCPTSWISAAYQALLAFKHLIRSKCVLLRLDNTPAVAYIRRHGGTGSKSLLAEFAPHSVLGRDQSVDSYSIICS